MLTRLGVIEETLGAASQLVLAAFAAVSAGAATGATEAPAAAAAPPAGVVIKDGDANQVLTETDLASGREILTRLRAAFPHDAVLDEESGYHGGSSDYTWVVDPIDGTSNFAAGTPLFGIMIGLLKGGAPVAGGVALPALGETYLAEAGGGARCNGLPIRVTPEEDLLSTLVAWGVDSDRDTPQNTRREMQQLAEVVLNCRNLRISNSAFDQMMVARGAYGGCVNRSSRIWDNVAPHIIIEEAGGRYTDFDGAPMVYHPGERAGATPYTWCTAAPVLHARLQELIHGG